MFSKSLAVAALAVGCVTAAAGGAYLAVRHNGDVPAASAAPVQPGPAAAAAPAPVAETEAVVTPSSAAPVPAAEASSAPAAASALAPVPAPAPSAAPRSGSATPRATDRPIRKERAAAVPEQSRPRASSAAAAQPASANARPAQEPPREQPPPVREVREAAAELPTPVATPAPVEPPPPPAPRFEELVVPASSVIGLRMETPLTTERTRVEDRVDARVTRDVMADGRVAIPAGARAIGTVTLVERGGKVKERARLGVRFHTLALSDGTELPITTEAIYREGESPAGESGRKIGGAAVGGAILGALIGGKKGAIVGGATGAAGGTAAVMAGDRNAATLPAGTIVTIRLAAPVPVEVEKR